MYTCALLYSDPDLSPLWQDDEGKMRVRIFKLMDDAKPPKPAKVMG